MDDLARQLVDAGAIRWEAGMLTATGWRLGPVSMHDGCRIAWHGTQCAEFYWPYDTQPDLTDPATAALLAVQAMERGAGVRPAVARGQTGWLWCVSDWSKARDLGCACPTLGEAAARALLAIHNGGTP